MPSLTISLPPGNNTQNLWRTTNVLTNLYVCPLCVCNDADQNVRQPRDSSSAEPISQNPSEVGEERAPHESQPANTNSELNKESGENALADSSLQDPSIGTTPNEELHSHRSSKNSEPFEKWERAEMEELLSQLNGQLGMYRLF